ncbi:MAG TPA: HAD family hydrolase [Vicinamibacterales bacterium]|nr:HAD family hydrolase [Vicinamibacterales bacterium]
MIFDLDGTLADTLADIAGGLNYALAAAGLATHPEETYRPWVGEGAAALVARALPAGAAHRRDEVLAAYRQYDQERNPQQSRRYAGVDLLLDALARRGVPMAILSNKPHDSVLRVVGRLLARWPFVQVCGERPDAPTKPDPTLALALACALGTNPSHCLFVGDTVIDMQTACRAAMAPIGVSWGLAAGAELARAGAWQVIRHPLDLLQIRLSVLRLALGGGADREGEHGWNRARTVPRPVV